MERSLKIFIVSTIFSFFTNTINTDLGPQTSDNFELGFRHAFSDALYANINLFRLDTRKEIFFNPVTFSNDNLDGKTRREGVEFRTAFPRADWRLGC